MDQAPFLVHDRDAKPRPVEIEALYRIDETVFEPEPAVVALVDDLLTTGAHLRVSGRSLSFRPGSQTSG